MFNKFRKNFRKYRKAARFAKRVFKRYKRYNKYAARRKSRSYGQPQYDKIRKGTYTHATITNEGTITATSADNKMTEFMIKGNELLSEANYNKLITIFRYFRVRGISIKLWRSAGPTWNQIKSDGTSLPNNAPFEYTYIVPRNLDQYAHIINAASTYAHGDTVKSYDKFRDQPNSITRLSYGDKPIRIYAKYPLFELSTRYNGDNPMKLKENLFNSDVDRYAWHSCEEIKNNDLLRYLPPVFWANRDSSEDGIRYQLKCYLEFKEIDILGI